MGLSIKYDYRFDPFTEADQAIDIADEDKVCPANSPYYIDLEEVPRQDSPTSITAYDVTASAALKEVSANPSTGEFRVDYKYKTGKVMLHSSAAGHTIRFDYKGTGHAVAASAMNALADWIGKNYTPGDDHHHDGTNSKTVVNISGNAATATSATTANAIADGAVSTEAKIASSVVSQAKLKTAQGEVSVSGQAPTSANLTLPGGEYGFYPRIKVVHSGGGSVANMDAKLCLGGTTGSSYFTNIGLTATGSAPVSSTATAYAQQRYITASGNDHWIFFLIDKSTKKIIASWQSPDHPCVGNGSDENEVSHPFRDIDEMTQEVVLVDNSILDVLKPLITRQKTILTLINEDCEIDNKSPVYAPREIIEIDEYGDIAGEKLVLGSNDKGEEITEALTPDWAKIKIKGDTYSLKKRMVTELPSNILYRSMKLKKGKE